MKARLFWTAFGMSLLLMAALCPASRGQKRASTVVPFVPEGYGCPLVRVRINGIVTYCMLDTGSDITIITDRLAKRLDLAPKPYIGPDGRPVYFDAKTPAMVVDATLQIGAFPIRGPLTVIPADRLDTTDGSTMDGLIGTDSLDQMAILFDFDLRKITFWYPGNLTADERKKVEMDDAVEIAQSKEARRSFTVPVRLNGAFETDMTLDTGADTTYIPLKAAKELKLKPLEKSIVSPSVYGNIRKNRAQVRSFGIGSLELKDQDVFYSDKELAKFRPHIGMDVLSQFRVLIDYPAGKLYLKPSGKSAASAPADKDKKPN